MSVSVLRTLFCFICVVVLSACSGGGGGGGGSFTVSGTVSGLTGTGLVLSDNGTDDLAVSADGGFTFTTAIANGGAYSVSVKMQPSKQTCTVNKGSGTIASANVADVSVVCSANTFAVGGTVSGLSGSGLVLQNNSGDDLAIPANGAFGFATKIADGAQYSVTVKTQPGNPAQTCTASSNTGTIDGANVGDVSVACSTNTYAVGGTVSGLVGSGLVLQNNGTDDTAVSANGSFSFSTAVASGAGYAVTVKTQPPGQTCQVTGDSGTVGGADVTGVTVACVDNTKYTIGGSVSGLVGPGLVLQDNGGDDLSPTVNGSFTFGTPVASGLPYAVTVKTDPANKHCSVAKGAGTVAGANVTDVAVTCASTAFTVGGTVGGMTGGTLVLQDNGGDDKTITGNGTYTFATSVANGSPYAVTIKTQPAGQTCSLQNAAGSIAGANVWWVNVTCAATAYTISGTVSGLTGTGLVLQDNGGDDKAVSANGAFTFATPLADGASYDVSIKTQPFGQLCQVTNPGGTVASANVSNVQVSCASSYPVGGSISGLVNGPITIQDNGVDTLITGYNGAFTLHTAVVNGTTYAVTLKAQPLNQTCQIVNGNGTVSGAAITNIQINCAMNTYSVGGTVNGLSGSGLVLQDNGGDDKSITGNGSFTFSAKVAVGDPYEVTVLTQPAGPAQVCSVSNGSGTMGAANVTDVSVACSTTTYTIGGTVSGMTGSVILQNSGGDDLTVTSNGAFSFAASLADGAGYAITVKASGQDQYCTVANGSGTVSGANVTNAAVTCSATKRRFAYVTNSGGGVWPAQVSVYGIDATAGSLTALATYATKTNPMAIAIDPTGKFAYVVNQSPQLISAYTVNGTTGALSFVSSYGTGAAPVSVNVDPNGKFAYVVNLNANTLSAYSINASTGELTEAPGSPVAAGTVPTGRVIFDAAGKFAYVANRSSQDIYGYSIDASTGALTPLAGSPFFVSGGGTAIWDAIIDPSGTYLYAVDAMWHKIYAYSINGATGALTSVAGSPFAFTATDPDNLAISPSGAYLFVSNNGSDSVTVFSINAGTGALAEAANSPFTTSPTQYPGALVVDPLNRFVFGVSSWHDRIISWRLDGATGALTQVSGSPLTADPHPYSIVVTP